MILLVLTLLLDASIGDRAFAVEYPQPESTGCVEFADDPFDPGKLMHFGPYAGQCMDTDEKRPAYILSETDDGVSFANFRHDGHFWIALIPAHGVGKVIFQLERVTDALHIVTVAHTQLRFVMKPDAAIALVRQEEGSDPTPIWMRDFVFSTDYMAPHGIPFRLVRAELRDFALSGHFNSSADRIAEEIQRDGNTVEQLLLQLSPEDSDRLLWMAVRQSSAVGMDTVYDLISNNCATEAFRLLDTTLDYGKPVPPFKIDLWDITDPVTISSKKGLRARGLISDSSELPTWNEEIQKGHDKSPRR